MKVQDWRERLKLQDLREIQKVKEWNARQKVQDRKAQLSRAAENIELAGVRPK